MKLLEENAGVALPNFPSFSIIERLYHYEHRNFRQPCEELIQSCVTYLKKVLIQLLHQIFDQETTYKATMIHKLTDIILHELDKNDEHCSHDITKMLNIERRVFTLNHYYMDTVNKLKTKIQECIENKKSEYSRCEIYRNEVIYIMHILPGTPNVGQQYMKQNVNVNDFTIDLSAVSNEHQAALDVQIAVKAYCRVVEKRVIDQAAQLCQFWFIDECALKLDSKLSSTFTSATLFEWMREPFEQQQKRENLKKSIRAMEKALITGQNA